MDRQQKVSVLLAKAEDIRRSALNELDDVARKTNTFGSKEHRSGRDKVERDYDQEALRCERLEDPALDLELANAR